MKKFYSERCTCGECEHVARAQKISKSLVNALSKLCGFYKEYRIPAKREDLGLTNIQYATVASLKLWRMATSPASGTWVPTKYGQDFLAGLVSTPEHLVIINRRIVQPAHPAYQAYEKRRGKPMRNVFIDQVDINAKTRQEYQAEKGPIKQASIF